MRIETVIKGIILIISLLFLFVVSLLVTKKQEKEKKSYIKVLLFGILAIIISVLISLPFNYQGILQKKYDDGVIWISNKVSELIDNNKEQEEEMQEQQNTESEETKNFTEIHASEEIQNTIEWNDVYSEEQETNSLDIIESDKQELNNPQSESHVTEMHAQNQELITQDKQNFTPNLVGMNETVAINTCTQNGYTYTIEYYLGGNGSVISQNPSFSETIEQGEDIVINIGISEKDFSNKLLALINEKRSSQGLGQLSFSDQLNYACDVLARENVNSKDCIRPDGSHWSTVLFENSIWLSDGIFTTRNNITSLSDTNGRIKYTGNSYGDGNLLTPSFNLIGMSYSSNNALIIIIGCE